MTHDSQQSEFPRLAFLEAEFDRLLRDEARGAESPAWSRLLPVAALAAAVLAGIAVALIALVGPGGDGSLGATSAQAALREYADTAESTDLTIGPGELLYQRKLTETALGLDLDPRTGELSAMPPAGEPDIYITESWTNGKGDGTIRTSENGRPVLEGEFDSAGEAAFGGPLRLTYEEMLALPRDPEKLLAEIRSLESETDGGVVGTIAVLLDTPLPPDLQSALLDAAALLPGATLVEDVKAPNDESLTAISYDVGGRAGVNYELLFDPVSGAYKGHSLLLADGRRLFGSLILQRAVVDEPGFTPASEGAR